MMKMDGFQHYKNIHVVDLIAFGVLRVLVLAGCVLGFFGFGRDIPLSHFVVQRLVLALEGIACCGSRYIFHSCLLKPDF